MRWLVRNQVKQFLFWLWCLGWLLLVIMSLLPEQELPFGLSDKAIHFASYAAMTAAIAGFCHETRGVMSLGALAILLGGMVELGQHFVPGRTMSLGDFVADAAGASCGTILALLWLAAIVRPLRRSLPA